MLNESDEVLLRVVMIELIKQRRPCSIQRLDALMNGRTLAAASAQEPPRSSSEIASKVISDQIASDCSAEAERLSRVMSWAVGRGLLQKHPDKDLYEVTAEGKRWAIKVEKRFGAAVMLMRDELDLAAEICRLLTANDGKLSIEDIRGKLPSEEADTERIDRALTLGVGRGWLKLLDGRWRITERGRKEAPRYLD